jgi:glycosyltransferase involved in cell wall biosynthesis
MNIGFISTWFERGAAYVTKAYINALKENNNIFVYARGGEKTGEGDPNWDFPFVTWGYRLNSTRINFSHFRKWIINNKLEVLFFNEQNNFEVIAYVKKEFPEIKIGSYIDYYKENTVSNFWMYDFLICNTKRHYSVFKEHPQCFFVPWGVDVEIFKPQKLDNNGKRTLTFFHSVGMSKRKGTDLLLKTYIENEIYSDARLIIHSQLDFEKEFGYSKDELNKYRIEIIEKTVAAPGLYHLGDVYVYPTTLDGLGLTMYEALSCGLPVIATDNQPMNEVVNNQVGYLVKVDEFRSRSDGYYWPLSICNSSSLAESMKYYINRRDDIDNLKTKSRTYSLEKLCWKDRYTEINDIFSNAKLLQSNVNYTCELSEMKRRKYFNVGSSIVKALPDMVEHLINKYLK